MSVSDSLEEEKLGVQIKVSSELIKIILDRGLSPSEVLTNLLDYQSPEHLIDAYESNYFNILTTESPRDDKKFFKLIEGTAAPKAGNYGRGKRASSFPEEAIFDPKIKCPECGIRSTKKNPNLPSPWNRCYVCESWRNRLHKYIRYIVKQADSERRLHDDIGEDEIGYSTLVALLVAYSEHPSPNPTNKQLIDARFDEDYLVTMNEVYPKFTDIWREELRTSKSRLTIEAKNMGFDTGPFRQSYGSGKKRKHPLYPSIHHQLQQWFNPESMYRKSDWSDKEYHKRLNDLRQERTRLKMKYKHLHIAGSRLHAWSQKE